MDIYSLNTPPYFDDFDPSKKYVHILARPGFNAQSREFTQIQSILMYFLKKLGGAILKEGSMVSGMDFILEGNSLTVHRGEIYIDGIIQDFDTQTVSLTKVGIERVGVKLRKQIVTEVEDPSLRDPAQSYRNFGQPGAHRLKSTVELTVNDPESIEIYLFMDGELQYNPTKPELDIFTDILARRTFDESGNFKVSGLNMWVQDLDEDNVLLTVDAGQAYVRGYEVRRPSPARIEIPKAKETRPVTNEPKVYQTATSKYLLNNYNVKEITNLVGVVSRTSTMTRGSLAGGKDLLPNTPVVSIVSVKQGGTTYLQGTDFQLSGNEVDWSLAGKEPSIGSSYEVVYQYNKTMSNGTDYKLTVESSGSSFVEFLSGDKPVNSSTFLVAYDYYLSRADRVYLDKDAKINVVYGQSDRFETAVPPIDSDGFQLSLGTLKLSPNSSDSIVDNTAITRVAMSDIHKLMTRLDNLEYNQSLSDLDSEAMQGESPTGLKGILTDGFLGFSKSDPNHPDFTATLDLSERAIILPGVTKVSKPSLKQSATTAKNFSDIAYTLGFTEEKLVSQLQASDTMNVNPYMAFDKEALIKISPQKDSWVNEKNVVITDVVVNTEHVWGWWNGITETVTDRVTSKSVVQSSIAYARPITITVEGHDYPPNTDLLTGYIDGVKVELTPFNGTAVGSSPGTVRSDALGRVYAKFTIPDGIRTGSREIVLQNPVSKGSSIFTSEGIDRLVTTNVQKTVNRTHVTRRPVDPLAQSFQLTEDRFVTGVDLYFSSKGTDDVTIQLRSMSNGYPTAEVLAETVLTPSQVSVSENATAITSVRFDTPAMCLKDTQYAVVIMTASSQYNLHIAVLGRKLTGSTGFVTRQPYTSGVLFSSSNALTWTAHQDSDLKFSLIGAKFNASSEIEFEPLTSLNADTLLLDSDYATPFGTSCIWEYKEESSTNWLPLETLSTRNLVATVNKITLRARLSTSNRNVTPVIYADNLLVVTKNTQTSGTYVTRRAEMSQAYTTVRQVVEAIVPSGATLQVGFSDNDSTWTYATLISAQQVQGGYTRYEYSHTLGDNPSRKGFRGRINMSTSNKSIKPKVRKFMNIIK